MSIERGQRLIVRGQRSIQRGQRLMGWGPWSEVIGQRSIGKRALGQRSLSQRSMAKGRWAEVNGHKQLYEYNKNKNISLDIKIFSYIPNAHYIHNTLQSFILVFRLN